jgi:hypothetical protein
MEVDRLLWNYVVKSRSYKNEISHLSDKCQLDGDNVQFELTSADHQLLDKILAECRQTVTTETLALDDNETIDESVIAELNKSKSAYIALVSCGQLAVTGRQEEISSVMGTLDELYGITREKSNKAEKDVICLDVALWSYITKTGGQWVRRLDELKRVPGITIEDKIDESDSKVRLTVTGVDQSVVMTTVSSLRSLVVGCQSSEVGGVKTVRASRVEPRLLSKASSSWRL